MIVPSPTQHYTIPQPAVVHSSPLMCCHPTHTTTAAEPTSDLVAQPAYACVQYTAKAGSLP
eukprot:3433263-Amphidinium_carterae.1